MPGETITVRVEGGEVLRLGLGGLFLFCGVMTAGSLVASGDTEAPAGGVGGPVAAALTFLLVAASLITFRREATFDAAGITWKTRALGVTWSSTRWERSDIEEVVVVRSTFESKNSGSRPREQVMARGPKGARALGPEARFADTKAIATGAHLLGLKVGRPR